MKYLLDTNTVSHYLRGQPGIVKRIQAQPPDALGISAITALELHYGIERRRSPTLSAAVSGFLSGIRIVCFSAAAAEQAGTIRAQLERTGVALALADSQIAGQALVDKLTLISGDKAFLKVPRLVVRDWAKT